MSVVKLLLLLHLLLALKVRLALCVVKISIIWY